MTISYFKEDRFDTFPINMLRLKLDWHAHHGRNHYARNMYNTCPVFFAFSNYRVGFPTLHAVVSVEF